MTAQKTCLTGPEVKTALCTDKTWKLHLTLAATNNSIVADNIYAELHACIKNTRQLGPMRLSNVQEFGIDIRTMTEGRWAHATAQRCMHQLLQLFQSLKTLCVSTTLGSQLLLELREVCAPSICRAGLVLNPRTDELIHLPALLPHLDTLCLKFGGCYLAASYLQPLSQLLRLAYLSLDLATAYWTIPDVSHMQSLRHLTLRSYSTFDFSDRIDLQQLDSLCLSGITIQHPEVLARLKVSSLTLQSVGVVPSETHDNAPGPCWPNLKNLYLRGTVSEKLLQSLLLPTTGLKVKLRGDGFDTFLNELCKDTKTWPRKCRSRYADTGL